MKDGNKLHREFGFRDFVRAFAFMSGVALRAEALGHHQARLRVADHMRVLATACGA